MSDHRYQHRLSKVARKFADVESADPYKGLKAASFGLILTVKEPASDSEQD